MQPGSDVYHSILVSRLLSNNLRKNVGTDLTQKRQANSRACKKQNKLYTKDKGFNRYLFHFWFQTRFNNIPYFCNKNWISGRHLGNFYSVLLLLPRTHVPTNSLRSKRQLNTIYTGENITYQRLLIKPIFSVLAHAEKQFFQN